MRYKVGDKVKIATWKINAFRSGIVKYLKKYCSDNILTVESLDGDWYIMKETKKYFWNDSDIECLVEEYISDPILSRFEILDIR